MVAESKGLLGHSFHIFLHPLDHVYECTSVFGAPSVCICVRVGGTRQQRCERVSLFLLSSSSSRYEKTSFHHGCHSHSSLASAGNNNTPDLGCNHGGEMETFFGNFLRVSYSLRKNTTVSGCKEPPAKMKGKGKLHDLMRWQRDVLVHGGALKTFF